MDTAAGLLIFGGKMLIYDLLWNIYCPGTCLFYSMGYQEHLGLIVYRKGDIVKQPMKKGSFVPENVPGVGWGGVGHAGVGWVMQECGGSCRGGVGWVM